MATAEAMAAPLRRSWTARAADHVFYRAIAFAILLAIFLGFATTYYLKGLFGTPPLPAVIHVHALVFTSWVVLFNIQTTLVASQRTDLHRRLGTVGAALSVAMIILGVLAAVTAARLGHTDGGLSHDPIEVFVVNVFSLIVFLVFLVPALYFRRRPEVHKRLMLLATTMGLIPAAVGRWPIFGGRIGWAVAVIIAFALVGPLYDLLSRRRIHSVYAWGLCFYALVSPPVRLMIARTEPVHRFAAWLIH
ncbi:MAG: hypothetical protein ACREUT_09660 [Steroidobacteraceae bacterium]